MDALATAHDPVRSFAQVELAGMLFGIPAEEVLRALPRPATLAALPRSTGAIEGMFRDGEQLVAVVDLRRWMMQPPAAAGAAGHVMLVGAGGRTVGLAMDAVRGLVRLRASQINRVHHDTAADGFFHSIGALDDGGLIPLLDVAVLIEQVGAWVPGTNLGVRLKPDAAVTRAGCAQALVRIGDTILGLPATMVAEIVSEAPTQEMALGGGAITGIARWRGRMTPALDPARSSLGLAGGNAFTVILAHANRTLALPVDAILAVRGFVESLVQDASSCGLDPDVYEGCAVDDQGASILLVDVHALLKRYAVEGLDDAPATAVHQKRGGVSEAHVVYDVGQLHAAPMSMLREIIALPDNYRTGARLAPGIDGQCDWRGNVLPVLDLRAHGERASNLAARLMVARHGERDIGLLVKDVVALLPANRGEYMRFTLPGGRAMAMITVETRSERKSYQLLDLNEAAG